MMPLDPPPGRDRGKNTTINLRQEQKMWALDMSTTAGDDQRERAANEDSGEEGGDGKCNGNGDDGVL